MSAPDVIAADSGGGGYADLSPVRFLLRSAEVFPERVAIRDGETGRTYAEFLERAERLAGALLSMGVEPGDRVAALLPNTGPMLEAHFAAAGMSAALVPINTRLSGSEVEYILEHCGAKVLLADRQLEKAVQGEPETLWCEPDGGGSYEDALSSADRRSLQVPPEGTLLSVNYTSGTTGKPKGVMYTHRGAYLHALGVIAECALNARSGYLWTLPMFHCHGWAFTWAVTAAGGTHVCLRRVEPDLAWELLDRHRVTHLCGAPTVLRMLLDGAPEGACEPVRVFTGGAPPTPALLEDCAEIGWDVTHLYGLTETYGPLAVCEWHPEWDSCDAREQARLKARQGVGTVVSLGMRVVAEDGSDVPPDGETMGEVCMRGNNVTVGYFEDDEATREAFSEQDGWFHSGDVGVMHPDGYIELRDRIKDVIISGGENISSIEVEQALAAHPDVKDVAVVGVPDERWGETPKAFVVGKEGASVDTDELRSFARERLAGFKVPRLFEVIDELPTTSTGKVQKYVLRERETEKASAES